MVVQAVTRSEYEDLLLQAAHRALPGWKSELEQWRATGGFSVLWGYNPPAEPLRLAALLAYLRASGLMGPEASRESLAIVRCYDELRRGVPAEQVASRAETREKGLPLFVNFFLVPVYAEMLARLRSVGDLADPDIAFLESELPPPVNLIFSHAEWGAHNRAVIRADGLEAAAAACPSAPGARNWLKMAAALAADNVEHWEIEDASIYHPVWLLFLLRMLERRGRAAGLPSPFLRWYLEYFLQLIGPHGAMADFGDGEWRGTWPHCAACFELAARETGDRRYRWAAARLVRAGRHLLASRSHSMPPVPWELIDAHRWCADWTETRCPDDQSREVLDDAIGKKVVFRSGWEPDSTWMLIDYMDEGSWGWQDRQYLRDAITVEEEKMHHGHSDENSVAMLMAGGSLLLHDAGYRDGLPSGRWGAFRSDYFHNRLVVRPERLDRGQNLFELLRSSGAYRPVRTTRIDFSRLRHLDASRTRLVDQDGGWQWDRIVAWLRERNLFIVIDGLCALRDGFLTGACLWHTQTVARQGEGWFVGGYDCLPTRSPTEPLEKLSTRWRLLARFIGAHGGRARGSFPVQRHYGPESAFYEADSRHFIAGRWTAFVTALAPVPGAPVESAEPGPIAEVVPTDWGDAAVCLRLPDERGHGEELLLAKLDLERERLSGDARPRSTFEAGAVRAGRLATDAHLAHVRAGSFGVEWSATSFTRLEWDDRLLFEVPYNTFGLQPDGAPDRQSQARWRVWDGEGAP